MKEELLQLFPTPLLIVPYEESIDKELEFLKTISYREQQNNGNYRSDDSYLLHNEEFKKLFLLEKYSSFFLFNFEFLILIELINFFERFKFVLL